MMFGVLFWLCLLVGVVIAIVGFAGIFTRNGDR